MRGSVTDLPDNIDLRWIGRTLLDMRDELAGLRTDVRRLREDFDLLVVRVMRIDSAVTALRDDVHTLFAAQRDLRQRVEALERDDDA
jgi:hypothetical protein